MTYKTHLSGGICASVITSTGMGLDIEETILVTSVGAVASLIPDIDINGSKANKGLGFLGRWISKISPHRGFFHTPILYMVLTILCYEYVSNTIAIGFIIGSLSHLILDTFNSKGIMWIGPLSNKHYHIASIKTRSTEENIFCALMVGVTATLEILIIFGIISIV